MFHRPPCLRLKDMCGSKQLGKIPEPYASLVVPDFLHVSANLARAIAVIVKPRAIIS
jgi:hypothetical protein